MDINKKGTPTKQAAKCDRKIKARINQAERRTESTHPNLLTGRDPEVSAKTHKRMVRMAKERARLVCERQWRGDMKEDKPIKAEFKSMA